MTISPSPRAFTGGCVPRENTPTKKYTGFGTEVTLIEYLVTGGIDILKGIRMISSAIQGKNARHATDSSMIPIFPVDPLIP